MKQISMLLLTNGDEVFGEIKNENERGVDVDNALLAQYTMANGVPTILFRKFCTYSNNFDIFFKREHIVAIFKDLREEVIKTYHTTMEAYDSTDFPAFLNSDELLEFDPDFDNDLDPLDEIDLGLDVTDTTFDDSYYYKNKKRKVH